MTTRTRTTETSVALPDVGRHLAVLFDGSSVSLVGSEGAVRIRIETEGATGRLVASGAGGDVLVAEGSTGLVVDMFASLRAQARPRRSLRTATAAAVAAVLLGGGLLGGGLLATQMRTSPAPAFDAAALQSALKASAALREGPPNPTRRIGAPEIAAGSVAIPDELPSLDAPASTSAHARTMPASPAEGRSPAVDRILPERRSETRLPTAAPVAHPVSAGAPAAADRPTGVAAASPPGVQAAVATAPTAETGNLVGTAPKVSGPEAIMAAIGRMNPIEAAQAVKALDQIKTSLAETGEIPPEVLREIPHEIAKALRDAGVNLTAGERREAGRKVSAIVRLPETAIEGFRGRDGIASIPDSNSWVLTDGNVRLPLPGGGDIRTVDNMKEFGLQP